jgi:uncharacterized damage-inducible protein DinB
MDILDEQGRTERSLAGDEATTLLSFLDFHRETLAWKCAELSAADLRATVAASTITLGGLLKHLARAEDHWFSTWLHGRATSPPWDAVEADWEWDWHSAAGDSPADLRALWQQTVDRSRTLVAESLDNGDLDQLSRPPWEDPDPPSLRWILVHMIEEYARHNGHADFIRESIDGQTGV